MKCQAVYKPIYIYLAKLDFSQFCTYLHEAVFTLPNFYWKGDIQRTHLIRTILDYIEQILPNEGLSFQYGVGINCFFLLRNVIQL